VADPRNSHRATRILRLAFPDPTRPVNSRKRLATRVTECVDPRMDHKKTVIIGAAGRMGNALIRGIDREVVKDLILAGAVDLSTVPGQGVDAGTLSGGKPCGIPLTADLPALVETGDVFIDFSFHAGVGQRGEILTRGSGAWVIGTTGITPDERKQINAIAKKIPVVMSSNMSLGINLLTLLVQQASGALADRGYDIEVIEMHHRKKVDSPSGTALMLGHAAAAGAGIDLADNVRHGRQGIEDHERSEMEIGFHSLRGGDIVGDHDVVFAAEGEMLTLSHRATNRDTFAIGALQAASWVVGKPPGMYSMIDVLGIAL